MYSLFGNSMIGIENNPDEEKLRLVDDIFSKICYMTNDISIEVKVCACNLLVEKCEEELFKEIHNKIKH